jgi:hypothetical protein
MSHIGVSQYLIGGQGNTEAGGFALNQEADGGAESGGGDGAGAVLRESGWLKLRTLLPETSL